MTGREVRGQYRFAERNGITVVEYSIHLARLPRRGVWFATFGNDLIVATHYINLRAGEFLYQRVALHVIAMRVAAQQDLYIAELMAKFFDRSANEGYRALETRIDENVPLLVVIR